MVPRPTRPVLGTPYFQAVFVGPGCERVPGPRLAFLVPVVAIWAATT